MSHVTKWVFIFLCQSWSALVTVHSVSCRSSSSLGSSSFWSASPPWNPHTWKMKRNNVNDCQWKLLCTAHFLPLSFEIVKTHAWPCFKVTVLVSSRYTLGTYFRSYSFRLWIVSSIELLPPLNSFHSKKKFVK